MIPDYLTINEVAEVLRVSKLTIRRMITKGTLQAIKIGRSYRILREDLEEYLNKENKFV